MHFSLDFDIYKKNSGDGYVGHCRKPDFIYSKGKTEEEAILGVVKGAYFVLKRDMAQGTQNFQSK
jgi:predicted RNase H-like HicB family nuclease